MGLIAVIFGEWFMQETNLQEKQVVIILSQSEEERKLELKIRELTLLPLNLKFQSVTEFQERGAPKNTVLVIIPFQMQLPLYSPPLALALADPRSARILNPGRDTAYPALCRLCVLTQHRPAVAGWRRVAR